MDGERALESSTNKNPQGNQPEKQMVEIYTSRY